jgi:RNA polymerase sigma-70 factor (ECF subfamily)
MLALMAEPAQPAFREPPVTVLERENARAPAAEAASARDAASSALVARAVAGDRTALASLLENHAREIATLCHHVAGPTDAHDAAQESLLRVVRELPRFDATRGSFRAWATTIARNVCRDRLRRRGLERGAFTSDGDAQSVSVGSDLPDPERVAIARQGAESLSRALGDLPAPMRDAILMFHVGDSTYEEIAAALRVPIGTVMTWLHRGRQRLRVAIEEP